MSQQSDTPRSDSAFLQYDHDGNVTWITDESKELERQLTAATNNLTQARIAAKDADTRLRASLNETALMLAAKDASIADLERRLVEATK